MSSSIIRIWILHHCRICCSTRALFYREEKGARESWWGKAKLLRRRHSDYNRPFHFIAPVGRVPRKLCSSSNQAPPDNADVDVRFPRDPQSNHNKNCNTTITQTEYTVGRLFLSLSVPSTSGVTTTKRNGKSPDNNNNINEKNSYHYFIVNSNSGHNRQGGAALWL